MNSSEPPCEQSRDGSGSAIGSDRNQFELRPSASGESAVARSFAWNMLKILDNLL